MSELAIPPRRAGAASGATGPGGMGRSVRVLLLATAALSASNSVIFALIGNLQDTYGFSDIGLGVIAATGFAATFVVQILVAPLADRAT